MLRELTKLKRDNKGRKEENNVQLREKKKNLKGRGQTDHWKEKRGNKSGELEKKRKCNYDRVQKFHFSKYSI